MIALMQSLYERMEIVDKGGKDTEVYFDNADADADVEKTYRVIHQLPGDRVDFTSTQNTSLQKIPVTIESWGLNSEWVYEDLERIERSLISSALVLTKGGVILTEPGGHEVAVDPDRDPEGREVIHGTQLIEFTVQRTLQS